MQTKYTKSFKIEAVKKYLSRPIGDTYKNIASKVGISCSTLHDWVRHAKDGTIKEEGGTSATLAERRPQDWPLSEKFEAVLKTENMKEEEKNNYCRNNGIFSHHLKAWKDEFKSEKMNNKNHTNEIKALKAEINALQKELRRKDKALAETAALLVLKKKVQEILGSDEEF
jgi:transposase